MWRQASFLGVVYLVISFAWLHHAASQRVAAASTMKKTEDEEALLYDHHELHTARGDLYYTKSRGGYVGGQVEQELFDRSRRKTKRRKSASGRFLSCSDTDVMFSRFSRLPTADKRNQGKNSDQDISSELSALQRQQLALQSSSSSGTTPSSSPGGPIACGAGMTARTVDRLWSIPEDEHVGGDTGDMTTLTGTPPFFVAPSPADVVSTAVVPWSAAGALGSANVVQSGGYLYYLYPAASSCCWSTYRSHQVEVQEAPAVTGGEGASPEDQLLHETRSAISIEKSPRGSLTGSEKSSSFIYPEGGSQSGPNHQLRTTSSVFFDSTLLDKKGRTPRAEEGGSTSHQSSPLSGHAHHDELLVLDHHHQVDVEADRPPRSRSRRFPPREHQKLASSLVDDDNPFSELEERLLQDAADSFLDLESSDEDSSLSSPSHHDHMNRMNINDETEEDSLSDDGSYDSSGDGSYDSSSLRRSGTRSRGAQHARVGETLSAFFSDADVLGTTTKSPSILSYEEASEDHDKNDASDSDSSDGSSLVVLVKRKDTTSPRPSSRRHRDLQREHVANGPTKEDRFVNTEKETTSIILDDNVAEEQHQSLELSRPAAKNNADEDDCRVSDIKNTTLPANNDQFTSLAEEGSRDLQLLVQHHVAPVQELDVDSFTDKESERLLSGREDHGEKIDDLDKDRGNKDREKIDDRGNKDNLPLRGAVLEEERKIPDHGNDERKNAVEEESGIKHKHTVVAPASTRSSLDVHEILSLEKSFLWLIFYAYLAVLAIASGKWIVTHYLWSKPSVVRGGQSISTNSSHVLIPPLITDPNYVNIDSNSLLSFSTSTASRIDADLTSTSISTSALSAALEHGRGRTVLYNNAGSSGGSQHALTGPPSSLPILSQNHHASSALLNRADSWNTAQ
ncbi:unnamed protein product [Amoebophrya sp. A25]|nr:unnamed protein product [Amoebophrya sp. A25]|eukprot:GSA25T00023212001.1